MTLNLEKTSKKINLAQKCDLMQTQLDEQSAMIQHLQVLLYGSLEKHSFTQPVNFRYVDTYLFPSFLDPDLPCWFITLSHDPKFLSFNRNTQAVNYYTSIIDDAIMDCKHKNGIDDIKLFGSYELNKNNNVHAHFIYQSYRQPFEFLDYIKPRLTHRVYLNVAVDCKSINKTTLNKQTGNYGLAGCVDYIGKSPIKLYIKNI